MVFYADEGGQPAEQPFATVAAMAAGVPSGVGTNFYDVPVPDVVVPTGPFYVGVRWQPAVDGFFFVCTDTSPTTAIVNGFFIDDLASDWSNVLTTPDPIFQNHRAMMIRLRSRQGFVAAVPALDGVRLALLTGMLAWLAMRVLRR